MKITFKHRYPSDDYDPKNAKAYRDMLWRCIECVTNGFKACKSGEVQKSGIIVYGAEGEDAVAYYEKFGTLKELKELMANDDVNRYSYGDDDYPSIAVISKDCGGFAVRMNDGTDCISSTLVVFDLVDFASEKAK